jgi:hypothetical protein
MCTGGKVAGARSRTLTSILCQDNAWSYTAAPPIPVHGVVLRHRRWVKVNGKAVPVLNLAPRHEDVLGEWRYSSTHSLTSALDGGEWSASRPGRFTPRTRAPCTHWIGGLVGPRAVLDTAVKRKIPNPRRESNPRTPIVQPVAQRYTDWAITAPKQNYVTCTNHWVLWNCSITSPLLRPNTILSTILKPLCLMHPLKVRDSVAQPYAK